MLKKIISFSLWGTDPKYLAGALKNIVLAKTIYPDWICRFYISADVPSVFSSSLWIYSNVEVVRKQEFGDWKSLFWRFEPIFENDVEVFIARDTDSRLSVREAAAVEEWLKSDKSFHIMRDHPYHQFAILGGMWGIKRELFEELRNAFKHIEKTNNYGTDYLFLGKKIYPKVKHLGQVLIHDEITGFDKEAKKFPIARKGLEFVGKVFDENDKTVEEHETSLKEYLTR